MSSFPWSLPPPAEASGQERQTRVQVLTNLHLKGVKARSFLKPYRYLARPHLSSAYVVISHHPCELDDAGVFSTAVRSGIIESGIVALRYNINPLYGFNKSHK